MIYTNNPINVIRDNITYTNIDAIVKQETTGRFKIKCKDLQNLDVLITAISGEPDAKTYEEKLYNFFINTRGVKKDLCHDVTIQCDDKNIEVKNAFIETVGYNGKNESYQSYIILEIDYFIVSERDYMGELTTKLVDEYTSKINQNIIRRVCGYMTPIMDGAPEGKLYYMDFPYIGEKAQTILSEEIYDDMMI